MLDDSLQGHHYCAVVADHPWQGLLMLSTLQDLGNHGLFDGQTQYVANIFKYFTWEHWWHHIERYQLHSLREKYLSATQVAGLKKSVSHMKKTAQRLACQYPYQLKHMPSSQIRRRFGSIIEGLWRDSFVEHTKMRYSLEYQTSFPWSFLQKKQQPTVKRMLDHHMNTWDEAEEWIRQDLNKLCFSPFFNTEEHTIYLEWRLVLHNLYEIPVPVFFRHPHSLPAEIPSQKTALLQIKFAFEKVLQEEQKSYQDIEQPMPQIIAWSLSVLSGIPKSSLITSLFDDSSENQTLLRLENQVHVPLKSYQTIDHWVPEQSFAQQGGDTKHLMHEQGFYATAKQRPLFTFRKSQPLQHKDTGALWVFLERTMDQWWSDGSDNIRRDYYSYTQGQRRYWIYRDIHKKWFIHGIYA